MILRYVILHHTNTDTLAAKVAAHLNGGWELAGSPFTLPGHYTIINQAMVKREKEANV